MCERQIIVSVVSCSALRIVSSDAIQNDNGNAREELQLKLHTWICSGKRLGRAVDVFPRVTCKLERSNGPILESGLNTRDRTGVDERGPCRDTQRNLVFTRLA